MRGTSIRPFRSTDVEPVVTLWNRRVTKDPITEERFCQLFLLDPNFDPEGSLVAEVDGQIAGFMQAIFRKVPPGLGLGLDPTMGWITGSPATVPATSGSAGPAGGTSASISGRAASSPASLACIGALCSASHSASLPIGGAP